MKCDEAQILIEDHLDGLLDSTQTGALTVHIRQCRDCADSLKRAQQFRQMLKNAPLPPPSAGFVDRALRNAVQQGRAAHHTSHLHHHSHKQGFVKGFGTAIAAGVALWAVVSLFPTQQPAFDQQPLAQAPLATPTQVSQSADTLLADNSISISLYEPTNVRLAFHAVNAVQGATITISLSDNLELVGYSNRHTLEWTTDLRAGDNVLTLPIKALNPQAGKIVAQVTHNNLKKFIELNLDVRQENNEPKPVSEHYQTPARIV